MWTSLSKLQKVLFALLGGVLCVCVGCSALVFVVNLDPSVQATGTARVVAELTEAARPSPTATRPTSTPTVSPAPTSTSTQTATPTVAPSETALPETATAAAIASQVAATSISATEAVLAANRATEEAAQQIAAASTSVARTEYARLNPSPTPLPKYVPIVARIYTGVKVYYGLGEEKAYGFEVLGGSEDCKTIPSGRGIYVRYPDGTEEWKDRQYIIESGLFFVDEDDPALDKYEWYVYRNCP